MATKVGGRTFGSISRNTPFNSSVSGGAGSAGVQPQYLAKPVDVDSLLKAFGHSLEADPVSPSASAAAEVPRVPMSVDRMEWEHIQRVLREHKGNISSTARALNMHRRTLQRKLLKRPANR